jgi:hypothetical protein
MIIEIKKLINEVPRAIILILSFSIIEFSFILIKIKDPNIGISNNKIITN